jgi:hypothetical protein
MFIRLQLSVHLKIQILSELNLDYSGLLKAGLSSTEIAYQTFFERRLLEQSLSNSTMSVN